MDEEDIFKKLGTSLKFKTKKFTSNQKANLQTPKIIKKLDFFESHPKSNCSDNHKQDTKQCESVKEDTKYEQKETTTIEITEDVHQQYHSVRRKYRIHVDGMDVPEPITKFLHLHTEYGLSMKCLENISKKGFEELTPIQMQVRRLSYLIWYL